MSRRGGPIRLGAAIRTWWGHRSPRDRVLALAMVAAAVAYLGIVGAARPLLAARNEALAAIARSEMALAQLAAFPLADLVPEAASAGQPITATITQTAADFGLTIRRIEPEGETARLTIEDAGFSEILLWLEALETTHRLQIVSIEMERRPEPGVVSANLAVRR